MKAKIQEKFTVIVGSNDDDVTLGMLMEKILEWEIQFNTVNPNMRMHVSNSIKKSKSK